MDSVYLVVGNGRSPSKNSQQTPPIPVPENITEPVYGNSVLKLRLEKRDDQHRLVVIDWFTASNTMALNEDDQDFVGGPVLFDVPGENGPPKHLIVAGGKDGKIYLADRTNLGKWMPEKNSTILQQEQLCAFHIHGSPIVWGNAASEIHLLVWSEKDFLKSFSFDGCKFDGTKPLSTSVYGFPEDELRMPGGILSLSWDGNRDQTAIIWASHPTDDDAMNKTVSGTLRAFDARDLNRELWNSDMEAQGTDRVGAFAKFCPPVVANGKVYLATFSRELAVYGLLSESGKKERTSDIGIVHLRSVGAEVQNSGSYACARYDLRVSGRGIGGSRDSFLYAYVDRDSDNESLIAVSARIDGINASQYPAAKAGVMIRKFDQEGDQNCTQVCSTSGHKRQQGPISSSRYGRRRSQAGRAY